MLLGITLPLWAIHFADAASTPFGTAVDIGATVLCCAGLLCAHFADTQLAEFMAANQARTAAGKPKVCVAKVPRWRAHLQNLWASCGHTCA